jgi:hypothetical protein
MNKKHQRRHIIPIARIICVASLLVISPIGIVHADENRVCIAPFQAPKTLMNDVTTFTEGLKNACGKGVGCVMAPAGQILQYPPQNDKLSPVALSQYTAIAEKNGCSHVLFGRIVGEGKKRLMLEAKLFSTASKGILFTYAETIESGADAEPVAQNIIRRTALVVQNRYPRAGDLTASRGAADKSIRLKWTGGIAGSRFSIYRSVKRDGPQDLLDTTVYMEYTDSTADAGIKYYYKIVPAIDSIKGAAVSTWGYIKPSSPEGFTPNEIVGQKVRGKEIPSTPADVARMKRDLKLYEEYYESYFMITFIYLVGKMYVNRGELLVYRDFNRYALDRKNKIAYFHKQDLTVKFLSERFFRFVRDMGWQQIPESEIMPRVVQNGIAFCIRMGETESTGADGITRFIPTFEAVGFSTEYYRDYREWKSNTIVFASSDKELDRKIKEAKSKGY